MHPGKKGEDQSLGDQTNDYIADAHGKTGGGVFRFVEIAPHPCVDDGFDQQKDDECRYGELYQVGHYGYEWAEKRIGLRRVLAEKLCDLIILAYSQVQSDGRRRPLRSKIADPVRLVSGDA